MIQPMLAETGSLKDLERTDLIFEEKLDGVRCIAVLDATTKLQARSGNDITHKFPELSELHRQVKKPCILDGEITSHSFNAIQHRIHQERPLAIKVAQLQYPAIYSVFDILYCDHTSVKALPLIERKALLNSVFAQSYQGRFLAWQTGYGRKLFTDMHERQLEGVMGKAMYSPYLEGKRSDSWLKIKDFKEATYYICGITEGENDRASTFGSLILGQMVDGKLSYVGNVGSGFNQDQLRMMLYLLQSCKGECPFANGLNPDREVKFWTRPELRVEVRYLELSPDGKLRFPTFRRLVAKLDITTLNARLQEKR
jgi:bifunctional non-homologous end joining protein LigD